MKTVLSVVAVVFLGACGGVNLTCQTEMCGSSTSTYKACVDTAANVKYTYGGSSCSCSQSSSDACKTCLDAITTFCGGTISGTTDMSTSDGSLATTDGAVAPADASTSTCSIVGTFSHTTTTSNGSVTSTIVAKPDATFTLDISTTNPIHITGTYTVSGNDITMTNETSSPTSVQGCIGEAATYQLSWDLACNNVTFTKLMDACTGRIADANGSTLTRQLP